MVRGQQIRGVLQRAVLEARVTVGMVHQQPEIYLILTPAVLLRSILTDKHQLCQQMSIAFGA